MQKLYIFGVVAVVVGLLIFGYRNNYPSSQPKMANPDEKIVTLSTFTIIADMVSVVGGERVESVSLTKPGVEIHGYEPTPGDLIRASKAAVLFENGMNLELWTAKLRTSLPDVPVVTVSEGVEVVYIADGSYKGKPNPHAWMSPKQGLVYIENIRQTLTELSPADEAYFRANAEAYAKEIMILDTSLATALAAVPEEQRYLVTCEGAFAYLANDYKLKEIYLWAINDESGGSPQHVAEVIDLVKANKIPAVFCESTVSSGIQEEVSLASGAKLGGVLYVDSLSGPEGPASTYLTQLSHTVETIINGLTK